MRSRKNRETAGVDLIALGIGWLPFVERIFVRTFETFYGFKESLSNFFLTLRAAQDFFLRPIGKIARLHEYVGHIADIVCLIIGHCRNCLGSS